MTSSSARAEKAVLALVRKKAEKSWRSYANSFPRKQTPMGKAEYIEMYSTAFGEGVQAMMSEVLSVLKLILRHK